MLKIQSATDEILPKFPQNLQSLNHQLYPSNVNSIPIPIAPVDRGGSVDGCSCFKISFRPIIKGFMDVVLIAESFSLYTIIFM